jgi:hypothetical protein
VLYISVYVGIEKQKPFFFLPTHSTQAPVRLVQDGIGSPEYVSIEDDPKYIRLKFMLIEQIGLFRSVRETEFPSGESS